MASQIGRCNHSATSVSCDENVDVSELLLNSLHEEHPRAICLHEFHTGEEPSCSEGLRPAAVLYVVNLSCSRNVIEGGRRFNDEDVIDPIKRPCDCDRPNILCPKLSKYLQNFHRVRLCRRGQVFIWVEEKSDFQTA